MDTNIISTFAKVERLDLLSILFKGLTVAISGSVYIEIRHAEEKGYLFCKGIMDLVHQRKLQVISPSPEEYLSSKTLPKSFGLGERDSIAIAINRKVVFVTNEKKVVNYCEKKGVDVLTLNQLLRALWELKIISKDDVRELIDDMENKDNLIITSKEDILSE